MKKALFICAVSAAVIVTACCGGKQKVSAIMAGPEKVAGVVIEYAEAIDAESVCPEAFVVEGKEVVCAKVTEPNKVGILFKKDCCAKESVGECGEKHGCEAEAKKCGEAKESMEHQCFHLHSMTRGSAIASLRRSVLILGLSALSGIGGG